jgi:hypothetical protein
VGIEEDAVRSVESLSRRFLRSSRSERNQLGGILRCVEMERLGLDFVLREMSWDWCEVVGGGIEMVGWMMHVMLVEGLGMG